jgi:hypothetical protein
MTIFFLSLAFIVLLIIGGMVWQTGRSVESFPGEKFFHLVGQRTRVDGTIHHHPDYDESDD